MSVYERHAHNGLNCKLPSALGPWCKRQVARMQTVFRHNKASFCCVPRQRSRVLSSPCILKVLKVATDRYQNTTLTNWQLLRQRKMSTRLISRVIHLEQSTLSYCNPPQVTHKQCSCCCKIRWGRGNKLNASYSERGQRRSEYEVARRLNIVEC